MPSVVKAGGIVKVFPKMSLFPTACWVVVFSRQPACFGLLKGSGGGNFRKNDSEISENKPRRVHAGISFSCPKMLGNETGGSYSRAGPCACGAGGSLGPPVTWLAPGLCLGCGAPPQSSDAAAGGAGCGAGRGQWALVLGCLSGAPGELLTCLSRL